MEFRETLLAAQRNQQQKSSDSTYYKARFDPPKKENKQRDRLSENIQKFLAKKEEEERQKQLEAKRKREELHAMRDPKMLRKIQKTLKVIKSANKSVLADAIDHDHTAVTLQGPDQPDQDDYGYESQEAAAIYQKMMEKYSKIPDEPKFPVSINSAKRDLAGTRERVKNALQHEDEPVPHKRRRKIDHTEEELAPPINTEIDKKKEEKYNKPKIKKAAPPPMDFNQLLKLAEQKKSEPLEVALKKPPVETEPERPMTKKQKREYEEEMARRMRRQQRLEQAEQKSQKDEKCSKVKDRKPDSSLPGFTRIPKLSDKNVSNKLDKTINNPQKTDKTIRQKTEPEKCVFDRERLEKLQREKIERERLEKIRDREKEKYRAIDKIRLEKGKDKLIKDRSNEERIESTKFTHTKSSTETNRLESKYTEKAAYRDKIEKCVREKINAVSKEQVIKHETNKKMDPKTQNTYRIDKKCNEKRNDVIPNKNIDLKSMNGHSSVGRSVPKHLSKDSLKQSNEVRDKMILAKQKALFGNINEHTSKLNGNIKTVSGNIKPTNANIQPAIGNVKPANGNIKSINAKPKLPEAKSLPSKPKFEDKSNGDSSTAKSSGSQFKVPSHFDFDKYMKSLSKPGQAGDKSGVRKSEGVRQFPPADVRRKPPTDDRRKQMQKRRVMNSDSEYDSEMDDFIDDGEEDLDYSKHIKEIFGYDKSKYRNMDDDDDPSMESSFTRQMREEYISKKIGIMEDLEDMRQEALEKKMKGKRRRIDD